MPKFKFELTHIKFIMYYTIIHYVIFNLFIYDKVLKWFYIRGTFEYLGYTAWILAGYVFFVFIMTLFAHRYTTKAFAIFTLFASTACIYFSLKYNVAIDETMITNIIHTDPVETTSLVSVNMIPYLIFLFILPSLFIIFNIKITYQKPLKHLLKIIVVSFISIGLVAAITYASFSNLSRVAQSSKKYILYNLVPVNYLGTSLDMLGHHIYDNYFKHKHKIKKFKATIAKKQDLVVVLAIGEATRQKNMSLYGYNRVNTNPLLSTVKDLHTLNGIASIASTYYALHKTLRKNDITLTNITLNAHLPTACYVNFSIYDNCAQGEIMVKDYDGDGGIYDNDVIPLLKKNLQTYKSGERLILLHLGGGSHGPVYSDRFPSNFIKFKPYCTNPDVLNQCTKDELYNAYDNSLLYVDYVVYNAIQTLEKAKVPYVFIYLSDHGESLGENNVIFHGMPPGFTLPDEQSHIPLLVKASVPIKIVKKKEYSQPDIFDTILDLLNIDAKGFDQKGSFIKIGEFAIDKSTL